MENVNSALILGEVLPNDEYPSAREENPWLRPMGVPILDLPCGMTSSTPNAPLHEKPQISAIQGPPCMNVTAQVKQPYQTNATESECFNMMPLTQWEPPPDVVRYLGPSAYSVAGQLYWGAIAFSYAVTKASSCRHPPPGAIAAVEGMYGAALHMLPIDEIIWLLQVRLAFRKTNSVEAEYFQRYQRTTIPTSVLLVLRHRSRTDYLDSFEVERELRDKLGSDFRIFEAAFYDRKSRNYNSKLRDLAMALIHKAICWGDGPRWNSDEVSSLAADLSSMRNCFAS
jgi:hypothetical protein